MLYLYPLILYYTLLSYFHLEKDNLSTLPKPHLIVYVFSCIFTFTVSSPWEVTLCLPHEDRHKPLSFLELLSNWDANPGTSLPSGRRGPRSGVTVRSWSVLVMPGRKVNTTRSCTNVCVWFCSVLYCTLTSAYRSGEKGTMRGCTSPIGRRGLPSPDKPHV